MSAPDAMPARPPRPRRPIVLVLVALVAVAAVVAATLVAVRLLDETDGASTDPVAPAASGGDATEAVHVVKLEPADEPGESPFTETVTAPEIDTSSPFVDTIVARTAELTTGASTTPGTSTSTVSGTAPGLYGGSSVSDVCDPESLVAFLADDDEKAAAWAGVLDIDAEAIPEYVDGLTSVVLTTDTLVTNHGFSGGAATPHQAVLQAGSAVMVDDRGAPAVRCECGNPLVAPDLPGPVAQAETVGAAWDGLALDRVVSVTPAADAVSAFTVANLDTGELVERTVGPHSGATVYLATSSTHVQAQYDPSGAPASGTIQTSPDGVEWSVALETTPMLDVAAGEGLAVAVGVNDRYGGAIHTSTDGLTWGPAIDVIDPLTAVAYGDGTWVAVGDRSFAEESGEGDGSSGAIYRSDDGETWERVATTDPYENPFMGSSGEMRYQGMNSVAYGDGRWIATATECQFRTCMQVLFTSTDTITWTRSALEDDIVRLDLAHDGQQWGFVGGERIADPANNAEWDLPIGSAGTSPDGTTWAIGPTQPDRLVLTGLNPGDGEWLAVDDYVGASTTDPPAAGGVYRSSDLQTWEQIGTAAESTTSVALFRAGASGPVEPVEAVEPVDPAEPAEPGATEAEDPEAAEPDPAAGPAGAATVQIMTGGLDLLADDGTTLVSLPYAGPATAATDALSELFGPGAEEFVPGDGYCSVDSTITTWAGLHLIRPGTAPDATEWRVYLTDPAAPAGAATVTGPTGVALGHPISPVIAAHPQAPTSSAVHEGTAYDYINLDVLTEQTEWGPAEMSVSVGAEDGVVTSITAPVQVGADC
ncbi:DUF6777 domain-containing protein [Georgenia sp. Z1344]|uniref:DUF6777 domain-containing protein n=1 Tax=Georgenia sp. Z1344 TaxID=3416706 RepID=UPI003CEE95CE